MTDIQRYPEDIRRLIYAELLPHDYEPDTTNSSLPSDSSSSKTHLANYSLVCKEWQAFFEPHLYHRLALSQHDIQDFQTLVVRQRDLVKHLSFQYDVNQRLIVHNTFSMCVNQLNSGDYKYFPLAITRLLRVLQTWKPRRDGDKNLTLEMSSQFHVAILEDDMFLSPPGPRRSPFRCPLRGVYASNFRASQANSVSSTYHDEPFDVDVVRHLVIRRSKIQLEALQICFQSCKRLRSVFCEPNRPGLILSTRGFQFSDHGDEKEYRDTFVSFLINPDRPEPVSSLSLYGDFAHARPFPYNLSYAPLGERSRKLEKLSMSNLVDAQHFFLSCHRSWIWRKLKVLTLTAACLSGERVTSAVDSASLVANAGFIALQMPRLQLMELWHGAPRVAAVFRYEATETSAHISWHGTWNLVMQTRMVEAWKAVVRLHTRHVLTVLRNTRLDPGAVESHAAAIRLLRLHENVLLPSTLDGIEWESGSDFEGRDNSELGYGFSVDDPFDSRGSWSIC